MVFLSSYAFNSWRKSGKFIDSLRIYVRGGSGGNGLPKYGGIGGKGGDVLIMAKKNYDLKRIETKWPSKRFVGGTGENSRSYRILGNPGEDVIIPCPVGVTVITDTKRILGDLNNPGDRVLVAKGGKGGCPDNQYIGQRSEANMITLDLKLIADVGLVGFPNAGKSTLLKAVSRALPKIASYAFTTIQPNVGVMNYEDYRQISVADLPGLIEGAHINIGLGHKFLKHVVRTKLLLFIVDITGFQLNRHSKYRTAFETIMLLNKELELYNEDLVYKPAILAVSKMDKDKDGLKFTTLLDQMNKIKDNPLMLPEELRPTALVEFDDIIPICGTTAFNIVKLKERVRELIDFHYDIKLSTHLETMQIHREKNVDNVELM